MVNETRLPFYAKSTTVLLGLVLALGMLYYGRDVFVPIAYATLFAVLLHPISCRLERLGMPRILAIILTLLVALVVVGAILTFITVQVGQLSQDFPKLKERVVHYGGELQALIKETFGITYQKQLQWFRQGTTRVLQNGGVIISQAVSVFTGLTFIVVLVPIYTFLFLLYKQLFMEFFLQISFRGGVRQVRAVLDESKLVLKRYLLGLMVETAIIAALNVAALLLLGIDYAVLLGVVAALLNLIPYIGIIVGSIFPIVIAFITKDTIWHPISVALTFSFIQFLDNNLIIPKVVGSHVRINAIVTIVAVIVGGQLWGISGMFLFIPLVAVLKVIFDRVEALKPWGMVLGDVIPEEEPRLKKLRAGSAKTV
jgi:predicted PurR-regulated permease PerM